MQDKRRKSRGERQGGGQRRGLDTSWQGVAKWYHQKVSSGGSYFHEQVVLPGALKLLNLKAGDSLLDLACGDGVLARSLPKGVEYIGVDLATSLVEAAKRTNNSPKATFQVADISQPFNLAHQNFSHAAIILALQNVENVAGVFANAAKYLRPGGKFLIVLNHPYFRIPRFTGWGIDEQKKLQYRRIDRYITPQKIPINMTPGQEQTKLTWSFHYPLATYSQLLAQQGFKIELIEEWLSDKQSQGKAAKMENLARSEFPMFMALLAVKDNML